MGQVGARVESPLSLLREYIVALRRLLAGETVTTSGRYVRLDRVALDWPPATPPPVLAGAVGPRSLRLSGECADGTVLTGGTSPGKVRQARALIDQGRGAVGRSEAHSVVVYLHAATGPGRHSAWRTSTSAGGTAPRPGTSVWPGTPSPWLKPCSAGRRPAPAPLCSSPRPTTPTPKGSCASSPRKYGPWSRWPERPVGGPAGRSPEVS